MFHLIHVLSMTQDYKLYGDAESSFDTTSAVAQPSQRVVQNILQYARCCQNIRIGEINIKVYLN